MSQATLDPRSWLAPPAEVAKRDHSPDGKLRCHIEGTPLSGAHLLAAAIFLTAVPAAAHLCYSWMGFNPTDDGFILGYARRLIEGQFPHRDFISLRPVLSPALHIPFVSLGGEYTFWLSRAFVWWQFAFIAWCWTDQLNRHLDRPLGPGMQALTAGLAFAAMANCQPIMAWHTVDGLFLITAGLVCCKGNTRRRQLVGYLMIGAAALCKQNFLLVALLAPPILGDARRVSVWMMTGFPVGMYALLLVVGDAWQDGWQQLAAQHGFWKVGVVNYVHRPLLWFGILAGYLTARLRYGPLPGAGIAAVRRLRENAGWALMGLVPIIATAWAVYFHNRTPELSFALLGAVAGITLHLLIDQDTGRREAVRLLALLLVSGYTASISIGMRSPVWMIGGLLAACIITAGPIRCRRSATETRRSRITAWGRPAMMLLASTALLAAVGKGRSDRVYRDRPARELTCSLAGVLPGGRGIYTNPNTAAFLADLNQAVRRAKSYGDIYAALPAVGAHWVQADQTNPLPIDWAQGIELNDPAVLDRVLRAIDDHAGGCTFIVQKVNSVELAWDFVPLHDPAGYHAAAGYVRDHFTRVAQTPYFELYR